MAVGIGCAIHINDSLLRPGLELLDDVAEPTDPAAALSFRRWGIGIALLDVAWEDISTNNTLVLYVERERERRQEETKSHNPPKL
jgi:hypothetical protein